MATRIDSFAAKTNLGVEIGKEQKGACPVLTSSQAFGCSGVSLIENVDLTPLQIGAPRKWIPRQDIGSGGTPDTLVWAVKTTYTWRTFYRSRIQEGVYVGVFNCYVNTFGEWQCGSADSKQKGETKDIPVQQ